MDRCWCPVANILKTWIADSWLSLSQLIEGFIGIGAPAALGNHSRSQKMQMLLVVNKPIVLDSGFLRAEVVEDFSLGAIKVIRATSRVAHELSSDPINKIPIKLAII